MSGKTSGGVRLVYVTVDGPERARALGRSLVESRLAACVNILDPMHSLYRWEGALREGRETVLLAKTRADLADDLVALVEELHGYECPCALVLPVEGGAPGFMRWIAEETREAPPVRRPPGGPGRGRG